MVYKTVKLKNGQTATLDWLKESDLPELVQVLNSVIREQKYLFMNNEITDMEEEKRWYERGTKEGMQLHSCKGQRKNCRRRKPSPSH